MPTTRRRPTCVTGIDMDRSPLVLRSVVTSLQDAGYNAISPRAFPVKQPNDPRRDEPSRRSAEHIANIVRSDVDTRNAHNQRSNQEGQSSPPEAMEQKARSDGEHRCGVIRGERPIATSTDNEMADARFVRPRTVQEKENNLVHAQADEEGKPGRNAHMPDMNSLAFTPPLHDDEQHEERNAELGDRYHQRVQQGIVAGLGIKPSCNALIHRY